MSFCIGPNSFVNGFILALFGILLRLPIARGYNVDSSPRSSLPLSPYFVPSFPSLTGSSLLDRECRLLPPASGPLHALVLRSSMPLLLSTWLNSTDPQHSAFFSIKEAFLKHVYLPESPPTPLTSLFLFNSVSPIVLRAPKGIWPLHHLCDHSTNREVDA